MQENTITSDMYYGDPANSSHLQVFWARGLLTGGSHKYAWDSRVVTGWDSRLVTGRGRGDAPEILNSSPQYPCFCNVQGKNSVYTCNEYIVHPRLFI